MDSELESNVTEGDCCLVPDSCHSESVKAGGVPQWESSSSQSQGPGLILRTAKGQTSIEKIKLAKDFFKQKNAVHSRPDQRLSEDADFVLDESGVLANVSMLWLLGRPSGIYVSLQG